MQTSMGKDWKGLGWEQKFICLGCQNLRPALTGSQSGLWMSCLDSTNYCTETLLCCLEFISSKTWNASSSSDCELLLLSDCFKNKIAKPSSRDSFFKASHSSSVLARVFLSMPEKTSFFFYKSHKAHFPVVQTPSLVKHAINVMLRQSNNKMYLNS